MLFGSTKSIVEGKHRWKKAQRISQEALMLQKEKERLNDVLCDKEVLGN